MGILELVLLFTGCSILGNWTYDKIKNRRVKVNRVVDPEEHDLNSEPY